MKFTTRSGKPLWSIPYPQELDDIPMIVARQMDAGAFADMIVDNFDEMLRHLRRALKHLKAKSKKVWFTTPVRSVMWWKKLA